MSRTAFSSLPMDLICSKIIHPHILANNPETPNLLAIRATCIAFWRELSVSNLMGLRDETIQWLLRGKTQLWQPDASSPVKAENNTHLKVIDPERVWSDRRYTQSVDIPDNGNNEWAHAYITYLSPAIHIHVTRQHEISSLTDSAKFLTGMFVHNRTLFIVSKLGTVYTLTIQQLMDRDSLPRDRFIRHIKTFKQFSVPLAIKGEENRFQLRDGATKDGDILIFLTAHNYLLSASMSSPSKRMTILGSDVQSFTIIDDAILFQTTYGTINVLSLKQRHTALSINIDAVAAKKVLPVPALQAMWFTDKDGKVYYKCSESADYQRFCKAFK